MKTKPDGGLAFPGYWYVNHEDGMEQVGPSTLRCPGMTLRQWYAGMALQGLMDSYARQEIDDMDQAQYARLAFECADAMIAEGEK